MRKISSKEGSALPIQFTVFQNDLPDENIAMDKDNVDQNAKHQLDNQVEQKNKPFSTNPKRGIGDIQGMRSTNILKNNVGHNETNSKEQTLDERNQEQIGIIITNLFRVLQKDLPDENIAMDKDNVDQNSKHQQDNLVE